MAWKVNTLISTRANGQVDCEEFTSWDPGTVVDSFPAWMNTDELEKTPVDTDKDGEPIMALTKIVPEKKTLLPKEDKS